MSKTILIVDDSVTMRQTMGFTLREAGFAVLEGANGKEGLGQLDRAQPSLIITDLNMPVMDGLEFIRQLRGRATCKYTPVLMVTTESDDSKKQAGKAAGATGWIVKPFQPDKLLQVIAKVMP